MVCQEPAKPADRHLQGVKDLQGQTANTTSTLSTLINIRAAKGQCYVTDSGLNIVDGGQTTDPNGTTYIDQTISRKWIKINTILALKNLFVEATAQGRRIPYTNEGIQQLIAAAAVPLQNAAPRVSSLRWKLPPKASCLTMAAIGSA